MIKPFKIITWLIFIYIVGIEMLQAQTSQSLSIDSCYVLAKRNYPLIKQVSLIEKSKEYAIQNASKGFLPQVVIAGQATYQSEVTKIPIAIPGMSLPGLDKDQYKLYAELNQPLTDLLTVADQKEIVKTNALLEAQKLEVDFYKLKERINQLYFSLLLLDAQIAQNVLLKKDIQNAIDKTNAAIANGIALKSSIDLLKVELLKLNQRSIELKANRKGYADMLSIFINQPVNEQTQLTTPIVLNLEGSINRPELSLFELQHQTYSLQRELIKDKNLPKVNFFFQGGVGKPALNMLSNEFNTYYFTGLRLNWNISGFYTFNKEKRLNELNQKSTSVQQEIFLFNTQLNLKQQEAELNKLRELIESDKEILNLRTSILSAAKSQLEYGTSSTNDYLNYLNAADQAEQNRLIHQIQLLMAQYNYQTISGN